MTGEFFTLLKAPFVKTAETNTWPIVPHPQEHSLGLACHLVAASAHCHVSITGRVSCSLGPTCILNMDLPSHILPALPSVDSRDACPFYAQPGITLKNSFHIRGRAAPASCRPPTPPSPATYPIPGTKSKSFPCPIPFVHGAKHPMHLTLLLTASFLPLSPCNFSGGDGRGTRGPLPHSSHSSPGPGNLVPQDTSHLGSQHA